MRAATACGVLLLAPLPALAGCADPTKVVSAASYRNAVEHGLQAELAHRGTTLERSPECHNPGAEHLDIAGSFAVHCTASTVSGAPVSADGTVTGAGTPGQRETYRVHLGNAELFRADCLGAGCRPDTAGAVRP